MKNITPMAALIAAALFGVAVAAQAKGPSRSSALLPPGKPSVKDVHSSHETMGCATCHPGTKASRWASDRLVPRMSDCEECHPEVKGINSATPVDERCSKCHLGVDEGRIPTSGNYPRPNVRFSHKAHSKMPCASCHKDKSGLSMKTCYPCHRKKSAALAKCRTCHLVHPDGRLVTRIGDKVMYPPTWLKGPNHGLDWVKRHAPSAGADSAFCGECHREKFCQDCHTGRLRPRDVHPSDWMSLHGLSTRLDNPRCRGCHKKQSFCITCHRRAGVAPDSPSTEAPGGSGSYHKNQPPEKICRRAKYDITACVSCHSESSCVRCHGSINPHPAGFSRRCGQLAKKNQRACVKCHSDSVWKRCN